MRDDRIERVRGPILVTLVACVLGACSSLGGAPIGEVAELVAEGGTKPLRDELRPIRGTNRVIVFALDGVGHSDLHAVLQNGLMPHVSHLIGPPGPDAGLYQHAYSVPDVLTTLPSSTIAAWASMFTGMPPAESGIPGNEWWSRGEVTMNAPAPISSPSNSHAIRVYTDGLLGELIRVPTIYEQIDLRAHVAMQQVHRGADLLQLAEIAQFGDLFEAALGATMDAGLEDPEVYRETDQTAVASVLSDLQGNGIPDLQVVYFGGPDLITHQADNPTEHLHSYLGDVIDPLIGRVLDAYRAAGVMDSTHVVIVSDHGFTEVLGDDRHALGTDGPGEPPAVLESAGFRVRPSGPGDDDGDFQAVLAYQGALASVYLADRSSCERTESKCDWSAPPRFREDVLVAARAFDEANASGAHVPELRGTLDLILARQAVRAGEISNAFQVYVDGGLVPLGEYLEGNPRPDLLRLEERLTQLAVGPYGHLAGEILLLTRWGSHLPLEERFYFGPEGYRSFHGGATAEDSHVPLIVAHPQRDGTELRSLLEQTVGESPSNLIVAPLVRILLDGAPLNRNDTSPPQP